LNLLDEIGAAMQGAGVAADVAERAAAAVVARLEQPDVCAYLADAVAKQLDAATTAHQERPDLYDDAWGPHVAAQLAVGVVLDCLDPHGPEHDVDPREAGARLAALRYEGWDFALIRWGPDSFAVRVQGHVPDIDSPDRRFTKTNWVPIRKGRVDLALLQALLHIEEHELRERLSRLGWRTLNPHWGGNAIRPLNVKDEARTS
jgi:hypothetical protein